MKYYNVEELEWISGLNENSFSYSFELNEVYDDFFFNNDDVKIIEKWQHYDVTATSNVIDITFRAFIMYGKTEDTKTQFHVEMDEDIQFEVAELFQGGSWEKQLLEFGEKQ